MSEWINIKIKLPDLYEYVLVLANNQGTDEPKPISIARIETYNGNWKFFNHSPCMPDFGVYMDIEYDIDSEKITHWMPLPNSLCKAALHE